MLFPYHLSDIIVTELRISPFSYYVNILSVSFSKFKYYDSKELFRKC